MSTFTDRHAKQIRLFDCPRFAEPFRNGVIFYRPHPAQDLAGKTPKEVC